MAALGAITLFPERAEKRGLEAAAAVCCCCCVPHGCPPSPNWQPQKWVFTALRRSQIRPQMGLSTATGRELSRLEVEEGLDESERWAAAAEEEEGVQRYRTDLESTRQTFKSVADTWLSCNSKRWMLSAMFYFNVHFQCSQHTSIMIQESTCYRQSVWHFDMLAIFIFDIQYKEKKAKSAPLVSLFVVQFIQQFKVLYQLHVTEGSIYILIIFRFSRLCLRKVYKYVYFHSKWPLMSLWPSYCISDVSILIYLQKTAEVDICHPLLKPRWIVWTSNKSIYIYIYAENKLIGSYFVRSITCIYRLYAWSRPVASAPLRPAEVSIGHVPFMLQSLEIMRPNQ